MTAKTLRHEDVPRFQFVGDADRRQHFVFDTAAEMCPDLALAGVVPGYAWRFSDSSTKYTRPK